jgi:outer membrane biogenesis lipoprotein LolB
MKIHLTKTLFMKKILKCIGHCIPVLAILLLGACHAQEPKGNRVNKSSLIFKAEVLLLQTSTINWSDPSDLAVVRLIEIFK